MMLGHPECVEAALIHAFGVLHDLMQRAAELLVRIAALVDRRTGIAEIRHVSGAVVRTVEFRDHWFFLTLPLRGWCPRSASSSTPAEFLWQTISDCARRCRKAHRQSGTPRSARNRRAPRAAFRVRAGRGRACPRSPPA